MKVFNKYHLFKISELFALLLWNINNSKSVKKSKKYFLIIFFQTVLFISSPGKTLTSPFLPLEEGLDGGRN